MARRRRHAMAELAEGRAPWAIPWPCVHEFLAIVTHPRLYSPPTPLATALDQVDAWLESPSLALLAESDGYWSELRTLVRDGQIAGPQIHDARIAALCRHHGFRELWTADRDFGRFAGIVHRNPSSSARARAAGLLPLFAGGGLLVWCIALFATVGRGTPAPSDPPTRLVALGPYRIVRNPMYLGVLLLLLGEAVLWSSPGLLFYMAGVASAFHLFIVLYEEPGLPPRFGAEYERYTAGVPRWFPRLR